MSEPTHYLHLLPLDSLRAAYGRDLTPEQQYHIEGIISRFIERIYPKYAAGQKEHGGNLWMKSIVLDELINETLDFVVYADTLQQQIKEAGVKLGRELPD